MWFEQPPKGWDGAVLPSIMLMVKRNINRVLIFSLVFCGLFMACLQGARAFQTEDVVLVSGYTRPEAALTGERVELKLILKNESDVDLRLAGRLTVDGGDASEKEITIEGGEEGDLLFYHVFESAGLHRAEVSIAPIISPEGKRGAYRKIWDGGISVKERGISGVELKIIRGISVFPPLPRPDEEVELTVEIKNLGNEDARDVMVIFYIDGSNLEREMVDIDAGESVTVMVVWEAVSGERLIRVVVDPKGEFGDYRFDNIKERWITVR